MTRAEAVLFLSTMSFLTAHSFLPSTHLFPATHVSSANLCRAGSKASAPRRLRMDTADVCRGDQPTPGWVRRAQRNLARIRVGDELPDAIVRRLNDDGEVEELSVKDLFGDRKGVLVGVPGAFTPTCSKVHLPEFVDSAEGLSAKGAELVAFMAVNDVFVMRAWEESQQAKEKVLMLSDGNGDLSAALGLLVDLTAQGMGLRCKRFMCVVEGGVVTHVSVGDNVELVSAAAAERALSGEPEGPTKGGLLEKLLGREVEARAAETDASESEGLLPAEA
ncbi:unnamed protein product [Scytosiphon promiscuus]